MRAWILRSLILTLPVLLGLESALCWLHGNTQVSRGAGLASSCLLLIALCAMTSIELVVRWFRWHFLTRRLGARLPTRDSVKVYSSTLPLILTPLFVGEVLRGALLARRDRRLRRVFIAEWLVERLGDVSAVTIWILVGYGHWWGGAAAAIVTALLAAAGLARAERAWSPEHPPGGFVATALTFVGSTLLIWTLPIVALWGVLLLLGVAADLGQTTALLAESVLAGAAAGIPAGTDTSGAALAQGPAGADAWLRAIVVFRLGTVGFTAGLGSLLLLRSFRWLVAFAPGGAAPGHFDRIAHDYSSRIPAHVRERLLARKVALMAERLESRGDPRRSRGLDLGCGQGWYACAMAERGYRMAGIDASVGQIQRALEHADGRGLQIDLVVADATRLPFPSRSFDFVYAINLCHHIAAERDRIAVLAEIMRVLKPGGAFLLHEMNTTNPLFRFYMSYVFPLINGIDEGNERWILPNALPAVTGARWSERVDYFTFLPDFLPLAAQRLLAPAERWLEASATMRRYSAHYLACLHVDEGEPRSPARGAAVVEIKLTKASRM